MERYGDDAQRRMRTEDHVPSGRTGLMAWDVPFGSWAHVAAIYGHFYTSIAPCANGPCYSFANPKADRLYS